MTSSARLALPAEAAAIAALQRRAWTQVLSPELAAHALDSVDLAAQTLQWELAIMRPPLATLRVLVALETKEAGRPRVVGFAALGPAADPDSNPAADGTIAEFSIDPLAQRLGHGSRLLQACVDTLRADGFTRATWWVPATDDILRGFLVSSGWGADGAHSEVGPEEGPSLKLVRLHTDIAPAAAT